MSGPVDRFRKRRAALPDTGLSAQHSVRSAPRTGAETASAGGLPVIVLPDDEGHAAVAVDADALLAEIHGKLDSEKIEALIGACQRECLQAVIRPFGLARVLFQDKEGGNVDTIHNVRTQSRDSDGNERFLDSSGRELFRDKSGSLFYKDGTKSEYKNANRLKPIYVFANESERQQYESRKDYDYGTYHDDNPAFKKAKKQTEKDYDLDHPVACKNVHDDAAIYLAEVDGPSLANIPENHQPLHALHNRAKGPDTVEEFSERVDNLNKKRVDAIATLEVQEMEGTLTDKQKKALHLLRTAPPLDLEELQKNEDAARVAMDKIVNKKYYTSKKFVTRTASTSLSEGGRMALQQAVGLLMEEFVRAAFVEVRDVWHNGFRGKVDDAFLDVLKLRLMRVADRVQAKWKDAAVAFRDGFISGFLSNLVTIAINAFVTTSARWVRITREGFMSLYRAMKTLAFPPEGMSLAEAADAASKLLVAGVVTGGGILLEEVVEKALAGVLGPLAPYVSAIAVGVATGLCTVFAVHMLDRLDLFGVNARTRHAQVVAKLDETISLSYDSALEAASAFDPPSLPHLA